MSLPSSMSMSMKARFGCPSTSRTLTPVGIPLLSSFFCQVENLGCLCVGPGGVSGQMTSCRPTETDVQTLCAPRTQLRAIYWNGDQPGHPEGVSKASGWDCSAVRALQQEGPGLEHATRMSSNGHGRPALRPTAGRASRPLGGPVNEALK